MKISFPRVKVIGVRETGSQIRQEAVYKPITDSLSVVIIDQSNLRTHVLLQNLAITRNKDLEHEHGSSSAYTF